MGVLPHRVGEMPQTIRDSRHNLINQKALRCDPCEGMGIFICAIM
jgi:hypothetical protein